MLSDLTKEDLRYIYETDKSILKMTPLQNFHYVYDMNPSEVLEEGLSRTSMEWLIATSEWDITNQGQLLFLEYGKDRLAKWLFQQPKEEPISWTVPEPGVWTTTSPSSTWTNPCTEGFRMSTSPTVTLRDFTPSTYLTLRNLL